MELLPGVDVFCPRSSLLVIKAGEIIPTRKRPCQFVAESSDGSIHDPLLSLAVETSETDYRPSLSLALPTSTWTAAMESQWTGRRSVVSRESLEQSALEVAKRGCCLADAKQKQANNPGKAPARRTASPVSTG